MIPSHFRSNRNWVFPKRTDRYSGTGLSWSVDNLSAIDRTVIVQFYRAVGSLMTLPVWSSNDPEEHKRGVAQWATEENWSQCWRGVASLGPETYALLTSEHRLRQVIHDLRGGPLTSLVMMISMLTNNIETDTNYIWLLARDVRKIARNCFPDLDKEGYGADLSNKAHSVRLLAEKWSLVQRGVGVKVYSEFDGNIANSCIEFSALDRVVYNLMNNALRESASDAEPVKLFIFTELGAERASDVRFWIRNTIERSKFHELSQRFGDSLDELFLTSYSTTGSGLGLQIVGDFVGQAYGVNTRRAIEQRIVGAIVSEQHFDVWFHWPAVD